MIEEIKVDIESRMQSTIGSTKSDLSGIRAGRASPNMLDSIRADVYGQKMPINQIGNITTPDARTINVEIWDQTNIPIVEKALSESDLGINPQTEGLLIRLPLPQLTEERRVEFLKLAGKISENSKVAIRNIRRDGIEKYKKTKPIIPTNTPDRGVKYNFPVTPKTGIKDAKTVHKVYKIACSAVLLSLLPVGSIKNPAFS